MKRSAIWSIGTALPPYRVAQQSILRHMVDLYPEETTIQRRLRYVYHRSHIDYRHTCCPDFSTAGPGYLAGDPSTAERLRLYEHEIDALVLAAAQDALAAQKRFVAKDITHLIFVSCTGMAAPGPANRLWGGLDMSASVKSLQIGFMGCQAALYGLRTADEICRSQPQAVVLVVCAELCTLHFQRQATDKDLVINSLFSDGAAAVLLSGIDENALVHNDREPVVLECFNSETLLDTSELLSWRIGDRGFEMGLDPALPGILATALPQFAARAGLRREEEWAVHPGGRSILDAVERSLTLSPQALQVARQVLRDYGNMSSPSVLFVLKGILANGGLRGNLLAFGPGLSLEAARWWRQR
jgi:alpha-pyrone synthase